MEYTVEFYGWANSVIVTVENDEILEYMGMVDCDIEVKSENKIIFTTTLGEIRNSMHPKTYRSYTDLYDEYSQKHNNYKITYEELKGFGGTYTIKSENPFDIKSLHFNFLNFSPFVNVTVLEDVDYIDGEISFNDNFDFEGKNYEEIKHQFKIPKQKEKSVVIEDGSEIGLLNKLLQMINDELDSNNGAENEIIDFAKSLNINPYDKEDNFIGLLKLKQRIYNKREILKKQIKKSD